MNTLLFILIYYFLSFNINDNLEQQAITLFDNFYSRANNEVGFTEIIQILGGGTPKTDEILYWNGGIPFFTPKDIGFPYTLTTEKTITEDGLAHCNSRLYPINTVFVTARGTVGKVSMPGVPMAMNQSCYALIGKNIPQLFVYFYTLKTIDRLKHKASGAVFDAITTKDFETESIFKLSNAEADIFLRVIEPIYQTILNNTVENQRLAALRDSLLPKLMSGELDVSAIDL
ncbi:MAG: restriction endonuclease subunit S [Ruminococcus flavefaciens]|nr:restriction endonuclease subunit S [Ruminococcus flavefaciens]